MKTFKLVAMQIITEEELLVDIELTDGLIINKEDDTKRWIMEAFINESHYLAFDKATPNKEEFHLQVVITKKDNDPATFSASLLSVKKVDGHISILMEGKLCRSRSMHSERILEELIKNGVVGEELLLQFTEKLRAKSKLKTSNKN